MKLTCDPSLRLPDCFANGSPAERAFRSELGNAGFNVLHRPRLGKGVEVPNAALRDDLLDFIKQKQPGPRTVIVACISCIWCRFCP